MLVIGIDCYCGVEIPVFFNLSAMALKYVVFMCTHAHQLTPQRHEDGEENSGRIVKEVRRSGRAAGRAEAPEIARAVAQGTHGEIKTFVAHLLTEKMQNKRERRRQMTGENGDHCHVRAGKLKRVGTLPRRQTHTETWDFLRRCSRFGSLSPLHCRLFEMNGAF